MKLIRTCNAYPTQYDIFLDDGRYVYFRFRNNHWSVELYPTKESYSVGDWRSQLIALNEGTCDAPDGTTGHLTHSEVLGLLEIALPPVLAEPTSR